MLPTIPLIPQSSALYQHDRELIDRLLQVNGAPLPSHITDAARLMARYQDTNHLDLVTDLIKAMGNWGFTIVDTNAKAKAIWESGWRPGGYDAPTVTVGSGAETEDS